MPPWEHFDRLKTDLVPQKDTSEHVARTVFNYCRSVPFVDVRQGQGRVWVRLHAATLTPPLSAHEKRYMAENVRHILQPLAVDIEDVP